MQGVYKQELQEAYGITFNSLFCLNNMPIKRYADYLIRRKELQSYMEVLIGQTCCDDCFGLKEEREDVIKTVLGFACKASEIVWRNWCASFA